MSQPIEHFAIFKFRDDAPDEVAAFLEELHALHSKIDGIEGYALGANFNDQASLGFTHILRTRFTDEAAHQAYLAHPDHVSVVSKVPALLAGPDSVMVLDIPG